MGSPHTPPLHPEPPSPHSTAKGRERNGFGAPLPKPHFHHRPFLGPLTPLPTPKAILPPPPPPFLRVIHSEADSRVNRRHFSLPLTRPHRAPLFAFKQPEKGERKPTQLRTQTKAAAAPRRSGAFGSAAIKRLSSFPGSFRAVLSPNAALSFLASFCHLEALGRRGLTPISPPSITPTARARGASRPFHLPVCMRPPAAAPHNAAPQHLLPEPAARGCIPHPISRIPYPTSYITHPISHILHFISGIPYPASHIPHPISCIPYPTSHIPHPIS